MSGLPRLELPTYTIQMPSDGREVKFRPFTVKERSILLLALQTQDVQNILNAIDELFKVCTFGVCEINKMPIVDSEFLFIHIRNKSVGEELEVIHTCEQEGCGAENDVALNMEKIEVIGKADKSDIELSPGLWLQMTYPTFKESAVLSESPSDDEVVAIIASCIKNIVKGDSVYKIADFTNDEVKDFILSLSQLQLNKVEQFFSTMPKIVISGDYICKKCKSKNEIRIEGLENFFG